MMRWSIWLPLVFLLSALGLGGWALAAYFQSPEAPFGPSLSIEQTQRDLGTLAANSEHAVEYRLINSGGDECRVLGGSNVCGTTCCFGMKRFESLSIPPHGSAMLTVQLELNNPGPFEGELTVYVDDGGARGIRLTVRGEAVPQPTP